VLHSRLLIGAAVLTVLAAALLVGAAPRSAAPAAQLPAATQPTVVAEFDIARGGREVLVPVELAGQQYLFLLDTGISSSAIDFSLRERMGKPTAQQQAMSPGGPVTLDLYSVKQLKLGPLSLPEGSLISAVDLRALQCTSGKDIRGVIGMDLMKNYVVQIDFDKGKLRFMQSDRRKHEDWGMAMPLTFDCDIPVVDVTVAGVKTAMMLDSGWCHSSGALEAEIFNSLVDKAKLHTTGVNYTTAAGTKMEKKARFTGLAIGQLRYDDVIFATGTYSLLGLDFLSRHFLTLDFPARQAYFRKADGFAHSDELDMSGLTLRRQGEQTLVGAVAEGSPADKAGVRVNDVLQKIDDVDGARADLFQLRRQLKSKDGAHADLTVLRDGKPQNLTLLLQRRI
jgi:predicted aspartyl protease